MGSMGACRLCALIRKLSPYSLQRLVPFSSTAWAGSPRPSNFFSGDSEGGSAVYRHALKFQRPTVVKWQEHFYNSVSFIGTVDLHPRITAVESGYFGVHTLLNVKTSRESNRVFKILLQMWDDMAEISFKHLKPNDFIYVSGQLGLYEKVDATGKLRTRYKVTVKELNYVVPSGRGQTSQKSKKTESQRGVVGLEKKKNRLHLWQVFFSNPYEWWDNRKSKRNPYSPDFKHKDTGEMLWISADDPPWIERQLQLHDSRMAGGEWEDVRSPSRVSTWVYDE